MKYRDFGRLGWKVSALGFGCMRLPTVKGPDQKAKIDEVEAIRMIRSAIDHGVNYIDTAYPYHEGTSEVVLGKALEDGYRERVKVATKSPMWLIKKPEDFDTYLAEQLKRLNTDYVDFYLFHGIGKDRWHEVALKFNLLERAEAAVRDGRVRYLGFSFHDDFDAFKEIVDGYDRWTLCQIQYNYMDTENQAGTKGLRYAASKGLAVVVMEPLLGGRLANPPEPVKKVFDSHAKGRSPSDLALQWIWSQPEVSVILSGMSTMEQVEGNLHSADKSGVGSIGEGDLKLIDEVRAKYLERIPISCTKCRYCMPCPNGVDIPSNLELYNNGFIHDDMKTARNTYKWFFDEKERAGACKQCKECEEKCPQALPISELMTKVHTALSEPKKEESASQG